MAVMGVAHMGVTMLERLVAVLMGMPEGAISGEALQIGRGMVVLVMGIAITGIVAVAMGMTQPLVAMPVAVLLAQQQHHASGHQHRGDQHGPGERIPQHHQSKQHPHERCGGEQHGLAGRPRSRRASRSSQIEMP